MNREVSGPSEQVSSDASGARTLLDAVMHASNEAIFTKSLDGVVTSWSDGAQAVYGYAPGEVVGESVALLMPDDRKHELNELLEQAGRGKAISDFRTQRITKSGARLDVSLTITPIVDRSGIVGALTVARSLSEAEALARRVEEIRRRDQGRILVLDAAQRVALDVLSSQTGTEALRQIADAARHLTGARYAAIGVAHCDGTPGLEAFITVGMSDEEEARVGPRPRGIGVLGVLLERTEPLRIDRLQQHPASVGFPPNHPPMKSFLGVPIRGGDVVLGSLYLTDKANDAPFGEEDEIAVAALGAHAAVAIHNLRMLSRQRALVNGLIMAQEEERRAVAYDLHDGLTQYVMAAHAHLEAFKSARAGGKTDSADRELEAGMGYLKDAVVESRRLVNGLRTLALDDLGLAGALEQAMIEERSRSGWAEADFIHNIAGERFSPAVETTVYRIAQEALTNARKHSNAQKVRLTLLLDDRPTASETRWLRLTVRDWGAGFDPDMAVRDQSRVGLRSMYERVETLGGVRQLSSAPGEGTTIQVALPAVAEAAMPQEQDHR